MSSTSSVTAVSVSEHQLWEDTLSTLLSLSDSMRKRNAELEARVADLEVELSVWKQAHSNTLEDASRDSKTMKARLATLNGQVASMETFMNQNQLVLCVIDGDACVFDEALLQQGLEGGRLAAQRLTKAVADFLTLEEECVLGRLSFWVSVYFNRSALVNSLARTSTCSVEQFNAFLMGFGQASPRFLLVDTGYGKEGTYAKIAEYLQTYIRFPQTQRVFFAGGRSSAHESTLMALNKDKLLGKLVLMEERPSMMLPLSPVSLVDEAFLPPLPRLRLDGLFMRDELNATKGPLPLHIDVGTPSRMVCMSGGLPTPRSPPNTAPPTISGSRFVDPSLPLHKQTPPPCNEFYLMSCTKGGSCKYSHEYLLTVEQLATLGANARKAPCNFLKNGLPCPYGERCCWGHVCPNGNKCFHLSKGKCWFKGECMHPPV
ncbi:hypothetical protein CONPUDRAFT_138372 [Coniophora puteana RWD-64-598 SS2]|uniref:C3H1-type domain-containing protein n=1 Tax=Coniophora puteana (strain RWD-64-598) TaxID=741705 RepID=A0A5M3MIY5_CONPW|nr:uncharacterized protein CONPUDRAFT_138372 [Coniophora puteana RWD-64-598 SS2]EIW79219.1 hypothetical protein CONPUDRAFT_138372 [Coniophora puteana RWD-64-598 SS2]